MRTLMSHRPSMPSIGRHFVKIALTDFSDTLLRDAKDRKSTRLNSSHMSISYAVFCLKKKKKKKIEKGMERGRAIHALEYGVGKHEMRTVQCEESVAGGIGSQTEMCAQAGQSVMRRVG